MSSVAEVQLFALGIILYLSSSHAGVLVDQCVMMCYQQPSLWMCAHCAPHNHPHPTPTAIHPRASIAHLQNHGMNGQHDTREADLFHLAASKSKFVDKLPLYAYPTLWNTWYPVIEVNVSWASFKYRIKSVILSEYGTVIRYCVAVVTLGHIRGSGKTTSIGYTVPTISVDLNSLIYVCVLTCVWKLWRKYVYVH